jgi:hypothetical protein
MIRAAAEVLDRNELFIRRVLIEGRPNECGHVGCPSEVCAIYEAMMADVGAQ